MREKEKGPRKRGQGALVPDSNKGLSLDTEETDAAHRKIVFYNGKRGNPILG